MHKLLAISVFFCSTLTGAQTPAQQIETPILPLAPGVTQLESPWSIQSGDNVTWSKPAFDDSAWPRASLAEDASGVTPGWRWYRAHVQLPSTDEPLALMIVGPDGAYEVYCNGERLPGASLRSFWHLYTNRERVLLLPAVHGAILVAIRVHYPALHTEVYDLGLRQVWIGSASAIETQRSLEQHRRLVRCYPTIAIDSAMILVGIAALILFAMRSTSREFLYLGLFLITSALSLGPFLIIMAGSLPIFINAILSDPLSAFVFILQIEFSYAFAGRKVHRGFRFFEYFLLLFFVASVLVEFGLIPARPYLLVEAILDLPVSIAMPVVIAVWMRRGYREAGWLILPTLLLGVNYAIVNFALLADHFGLGNLAFIADPVTIGIAVFNQGDIAQLTFLISIGIIMLLRFTRVSRDQARTAAELDAARELQRRLVPTAMPAIAGFELNAAYLPAAEVGGDFYQILPQPGDAALIVVGDVSGKGLKAAMTGVLAIGALRTLAAEFHNPGEILVRLNNQMVEAGNNGFITCLIALLRADGALTMANAGHLAPYCGGVEISCENGLPLGIVADVSYAEAELQLHPGDRLTLLTDGVLEACDPATRELYGFQRTSAISIQSAESIAHAAQQWGQEDDITVLTIELSPVAVIPV